MRLEPYLFALGLTVAVELILAALLGVRGIWDFLLICGANLLTNPPVNLLAELVQTAAPRWTAPAVLLLEAGAVLGEWALYRKLLDRGKLPPLLLSLILNAASFGAGLLWMMYF